MSLNLSLVKWYVSLLIQWITVHWINRSSRNSCLVFTAWFGYTAHRCQFFCSKVLSIHYGKILIIWHSCCLQISFKFSRSQIMIREFVVTSRPTNCVPGAFGWQLVSTVYVSPLYIRAVPKFKMFFNLYCRKFSKLIGCLWLRHADQNYLVTKHTVPPILASKQTAK